MIKMIIISIILSFVLITMIIFDKLGIFEKIKNKIRDLFDVRKYRKKANTAINKYHARNEDYVSALETVQILVLQNVEYQKQIEKLKQEKKDLKKELEEKKVK